MTVGQAVKVCQITLTLLLLSFRLSFILGGIAQLARASALQAEGQGFESPCLQ
jgi:hypothetical protein